MAGSSEESQQHLAGADQPFGDAAGLQQGPAHWQPPLAGYRRIYGRAWISVKHVYDLAVDPAERSALEGMLGTCA
ncbi:hypothetical protein ABZ553_04275 [Streptomyces sparsogenes]|uniref:hypothetical protein n=1 Tax=Streptomyces sparsogenes TaxID=67365 RepID=UPI0034066012